MYILNTKNSTKAETKQIKTEKLRNIVEKVAYCTYISSTRQLGHKRLML